MKPEAKWIDDWRIGENPPREELVGHELVALFFEFWESEALDQKSKTTRNRYASALHALGGYLLENAVLDEDDMTKTTGELLDYYVGPDEGPLIHLDNETWQNEIDAVCRKLHKHRVKNH